MSKPENEKHALQQALEDADLCVRDYSGRGMYGSRCLAVDGSLQKIMGAIVVAVADATGEEQEELVRAMERADWQTDSMGLVYWPRIKFVDEDLDVCEFDECVEPAEETCGELRLCAQHAKEHDDLCLRQALAREKRAQGRTQGE